MGSRCTRVLNAFRHQRINHNKLDRIGYRVKYVLNAFRHQRINHTTAAFGSPQQMLVLNAFRHQRINHNIDIDRIATFARAQRLSASKDKSRSSFPCLPKFPSGAQRLSASKDKSRVYERFVWSNRCVLNAFRHQRINHSSSPSERLKRLLCSTPFGIKG